MDRWISLVTGIADTLDQCLNCSMHQPRITTRIIMMVLAEASFSFKPSREISAMAKTQEYMQNLLAIQ